MQNQIKKLLIYLTTFSLLFFGFPGLARAASLTAVSNTMTRIKAATLSSHDISFTLGGSTTLDASETVIIDFGEDDTKFVVGGAATVVGDLDFNDGTERNIVDIDGSCVGHSGANDIVASVNDTTGILTFTACGSYTASGAGAIINVEYGTAAGGTDRVTNPAASTPVVSITAAGDTGSFAAAIITDDQFTVSATVDPTITFSLSATSTDFGTISTSVTTSSPNITLTTSTNATNGYTITIQDQGDGINPGLYNSDASYLLGSADASYNDTANLSSVTGYGIQGSSATATIAARYNQTGDTIGGYELSPQTLANYSSVADNQTVTITSKAKVSGSAPAGSYSDTVTVIATANF